MRKWSYPEPQKEIVKEAAYLPGVSFYDKDGNRLNKLSDSVYALSITERESFHRLLKTTYIATKEPDGSIEARPFYREIEI